jgi:hypothetical protein
MKVSELINALLKVLSIYIGYTAILSLNYFLISLIQYFAIKNNEQILFSYTFLNLIPLILCSIISIILWKKSEKITLKILNKNIDTSDNNNKNIDLNLNNNILLKTLLFIIGIFIFCLVIPELSSVIYKLIAYRKTIHYDSMSKNLITQIIVIIVKFILGFILIFKQNFLLNKIDKLNNKINN